MLNDSEIHQYGTWHLKMCWHNEELCGKSIFLRVFITACSMQMDIASEVMFAAIALRPRTIGNGY